MTPVGVSVPSAAAVRAITRTVFAVARYDRATLLTRVIKLTRHLSQMTGLFAFGSDGHGSSATLFDLGAGQLVHCRSHEGADSLAGHATLMTLTLGVGVTLTPPVGWQRS